MPAEMTAAEAITTLRSLHTTYPEGHAMAQVARAGELGADALEQLEATRAPLAELAVLRHSNAQMRDLTREQDQAIQATRDRLADLEVYATELHEALAELWVDLGQQGRRYVVEHDLHRKVVAALAVQPPQRGRALRDQVERLRMFRKQIADALSDIDIPNEDVVRLVADALVWLDDPTLDQAAAQREGAS